ncbi:membrane protein [Mycobacterium phage Jabbawokkie]|uniref:Membrane protein n=2 Tax=Avanivirus TaxID=2843352 RepID=A0A2D1GA20_9CAUD|nr:holin [Mycobacterium phage Jabbawokkie]YP_009963736.1 holin [Mycobacterium phage Demsculpinboyz]YP_009963956.1 holin [Mycobacterium phage Zapner]AGT12139.1 membrane protein [Mycobacterium phage Jabbawokkie]AHZ95493.1 membrane protein [Mycobacterium phage Zapner]ATN88633.1 membrane protein [Mycobacterium phage Demsculpinboyz]
MYTITWLKDTAERAISTAAEAVLASVGISAVDLFHLDWKATLSIAGGAALVSVLKSLVVGAAPGGTPGSATPVVIGQAKSDELGT